MHNRSQWTNILGTPLDVRPDLGLAPWADIDPTTVAHGLVERVALVRNGTTQGRASIALLIRLDDGRLIVAETTWRLFNTAARALAASPAAQEEV